MNFSFNLSKSQNVEVFDKNKLNLAMLNVFKTKKKDINNAVAYKNNIKFDMMNRASQKPIVVGENSFISKKPVVRVSSQNPLVTTSQNSVIITSQKSVVRVSQNPDIRTSQNPDIRTSQNPDIRTSKNPDVKAIHKIKKMLNPCNLSKILSKPKINYSKDSFVKVDEIIENLPRFCNNIKEILNSNHLTSFLLIVDFNNLGGGTSFFLESVIARYKKCQTFLIARPFNEKIIFTINDNYQLQKSCSQDDAINYLLHNKEKITKIFVNHTMNHSNQFLNSLFNLNKNIATITHDFLSVFNEPQVCFETMEKYILNKSNHSEININKYDIIITQNEFNLHLYKKFITNDNKIIVSPLPDVINSKDFIQLDDRNVTVIGIIGGIHELKGKNILEKLVKFYKNNTRVNFVVFGTVHIDSFINYYPYKDINELNKLLKIHKPNILIELSIWNETYSYTLTLSMLTQLPILYLKKNEYSVVENRLSVYEKAYSFETVDEFTKLVHDKKQNFFYTIEPILYFNKFWDIYFTSSNGKLNIPKIQNGYMFKNIVLITSKIIVSNSPFSYTPIRSIYTKEQRFTQTIKTIESVRRYIPDSYIVLVDNSELNKIEKEILINLTDNLINVVNDETLNYNTNQNELKLFGEAAQQICFYNTFLKKINVKNICNFYKISGRYFINDTFNYNDFNNNLNIFKKNEKVLDRDYYFTSFYKLEPNTLVKYFSELNNVMNNSDKYNKSRVNDFEVIVPKIIENKTLINNLGITQIYSVWNQIDNV